MKKIFIFLLAFSWLSTSAQQIAGRIDSLLINSEYQIAIDYLEKYNNSSSSPDFLLIENMKAEALIHLGKLSEAEVVIKRISDHSSSSFDKAVLLTTQGSLYMNQGRNDRALEILKEAVSLFESTGKAKSLESAKALSLLGLVYKYNGKHTQAQEQLHMALTYRLALLKQNDERVAASYNDLGLAFAGIDNDKALDYYEKALTIYEKLHGSEHPKIAIAKINIGYIYNNLELYGDATNNFESALKIWEKIYQKPHQTKAFALLNLGDTYSKIGNLKAAKEYFQKSLSMYRESYGVKHPEIAGVLNKLGNLSIEDDRFDEAIHYYQQALIENSIDFNNPDPKSNPELTGYYNGNVLLYSMLFKARGFEKKYFGKSLKFKDLDIALLTLEKCDRLIDQLRQQTSNEADKIGLGIIAHEVYADGVRIAYEASRNSIHRKVYLQKSFYFAEKSKSAVLLEAISESEAKSFAGIPAALIEEEKELKTSIANTAQKLSQKPDANEEKQLRETLFTLNRKFESFTKELEADYPDYFNLKYNSASPSIPDIQQLLGSRTAVISYFTDDIEGRIYIFAITKKNFRIYEKALPKDFDKYITGLRNGLYFNEIKFFKTTASKLAKLLIPSLPSEINDLIFLPTGRMSIVPFEALLIKDPGENNNYKTLPYLINRYTVRYEFSGSLLLQKAKNVSSFSNPSILLCAPVTFSEKEQLPRLPGSESEVKEISLLFASRNLKATTNLFASANESAVKNNSVKDYSVLHLATHGVVDEKSPELSRIFLQPSANDEDGTLYAGEIYNLHLKANLVTLSACQTGLGKISKGEGVIGLSRALVYAGAKNIIVSFWSVADDSTSDLMKDFYKNLLDSNSADFSGSLRKAKLDLIKGEKYAAPYYWAPFILIGF